jgi:phosphonate transport system permease protein
MSATTAELARWESVVPGVVRVPLRRRAQRMLPGALAALLTLWVFIHLSLDPLVIWAGLGRLGWLLAFMAPPSHGGLLDVFLWAMAETLAIALLATVFAAVLAIPFGLLCTRSSGALAPVTFIARRLSDTVRGVDPLVWALIFVNVVGLGPFAGILALTLHNTGDLAKLYSEAIENIEKRQLDGIRASGGSPFAVLRLGALPQFLPVLTSQALYYFESNTRSATIIGAVGAGGIGLLLTERIRLYRWDEVAFLILMILAAVYAIDAMSQRLRILLIEGRKAPLVS